MPRYGKYLFQRDGSQNWYLRLQYPDEKLHQTAEWVLGRKVKKKDEKSLGTPDRREAEIIALPRILEHKKVLLVHAALTDPHRSHGRIAVKPTMPPNSSITHPDGTRTLATETELIHLDANGSIVKTEPNAVRFEIEIDEGVLTPAQRQDIKEGEEGVKKALYKDVDSEIIENWIEVKKPSKTHAQSARNMLKLFKELTGGKTFVTADRDDARLLVQHLEKLGNVSSTIKTKFSGLVAAVYLEMAQKSPRVKYNPFADVAHKSDKDTTDRLSLDEDDVATMRAHLHLLGPEERLMWTWCISSGMRPKEVYDIQEEFREKLSRHPETGEPSDIRYIWITKTKTKAGKRKLPIPDSVLPLLPNKISGPLFRQPLGNILIHINDAMQRAGITSPDPHTGRERKVFYGARHRCKDRLLHQGCPEDFRKAIMGHTKNVHDQYGQGLQMWQLKPWVERIGC